MFSLSLLLVSPHPLICERRKLYHLHKRKSLCHICQHDELVNYHFNAPCLCWATVNNEHKTSKSNPKYESLHGVLTPKKHKHLNWQFSIAPSAAKAGSELCGDKCGPTKHWLWWRNGILIAFVCISCVILGCRDIKRGKQENNSAM